MATTWSNWPKRGYIMAHMAKGKKPTRLAYVTYRDEAYTDQAIGSLAMLLVASIHIAKDWIEEQAIYEDETGHLQTASADDYEHTPVGCMRVVRCHPDGSISQSWMITIY